MDDLATQTDVSLYDRDFYAWTQEQAALIRDGNLAGVDLPNILEEIETFGRSEASALESAYRLICMHQLKRMVQVERPDGRSWTDTIIRERNHATRLLRDNPGLKAKQGLLFNSAYADARREAAGETGLPLSMFPVDPPFSHEDIASHDYWALPASEQPS